jgi:hypothetical protein
MTDTGPTDETWQKLTRTLLRAVRSVSGMRWPEFCGELGVEEWKAVRESSWDDRKYPTAETRDKLLTFCERNSDYAVEPFDQLRQLMDRPGPPKATSPFMSKLGLHAEDVKRSASRHAGEFVFFILDEDGKVIVCKAKLDRKYGADGLPTFQMGRDVNGARRSVVGGYYSTEDELFLTGYRQDHRDVRLMIFRVERPSVSPTSDEDENSAAARTSNENLVREQQFYRGLVAGVSWIHSIFASRCVLIRETYAKQLLKEGHRHQDWKTLIGEKELSYIESAFPDVASYLATNGPVNLPPTRMTHEAPDM